MVGNSKVGKSVFIRNALDLRRPVSSISTCKVSLGGVSYRLQLLETPRESVELTNGSILWPPLRDSAPNPKIDGVLCLYDVSDRDSLVGLFDLLKELEACEIATCLVSCKNDIPISDQEIPVNFPERVIAKFPSVAFESAQSDSSDSAKRCLLRILKEFLAMQSRRFPTSERSRINSNTHSDFPPRVSSRDPSTSSSRSRSGSRNRPIQSKSRENLLTLPPSPVLESEDEDEDEERDDSESSSGDDTDQPINTNAQAPLRLNTAQLTQEPPLGLQTPISPTKIAGNPLVTPTRGTNATPATPESIIGAAMARRGSADTTGSRIGRTFLNMDDESIHGDYDGLDDTTTMVSSMDLDNDPSVEGVSFGQLVDRLLAMPVTKGDQKFGQTFLCLYRIFATPMRLFTAIMERFLKTEASDLVPLTKAAELLRYLAVLGLWTTHYPGDFADPRVRKMADTFISAIEKIKQYGAAARQVANNLQTFVPDEDGDWAFIEPTSARSRSNTTSQKMATKDVRTRKRSVAGPEDEESNSDDETPARSTRHSATTSTASSFIKASQISSQTSDNLQNLEAAREQAKKLRTIPHNLVCKGHYHHLMHCTVDELAIEITRIDWTMYTAVRPRDFVRYVTLPLSQRAREGEIDYIGMMTKHFNHLALFVSGMILLRDKPKHRAPLLEKFMDLAWKVRQMNNYHALGALVAALNSEEIVRLSQTQELISQDKHKEFMRLKILMGHQKSHAAYRMAWDNSSSERIPFLPRIQEDLTKAASANATWIGNRINWAKFEVMGETILSIQKSQDQPYNFPDRTARGQEVSKLILETKVLEGDEVSIVRIIGVIETNMNLGLC